MRRVGVDVAIVIPCFNGERFVAATIESALAQTHPSVEVIVVDDGSTDSSLDVIEAAGGDRVVVVSIPNGGVARARNVGLEHCSPDVEFVLFLDADDLLRPDAVERLRERLVAEPDLVAAAGAASRIDDGGTLVAPAPSLVEAHEIGADRRVRVVTGVDRIGFWHLLPVTAIGSPGLCLARRAEIEAIGGFDESLRSCEDWDLWLRLSRRGDIGLVHHWVFEYRDHAGGKSKKHRVSRGHRDLIYRKHIVAAAVDDRPRVVAARSYGMYGYDMRACAGWCVDELRAGHPANATRLGVRAARYLAKYAASRVRAGRV